MVRLVLLHRNCFASKSILFDGSVLLVSFYFKNKWLRIKSKNVTDHIRHAARACFDNTGINPEELTARSLQAGGAMALLCAEFDSDQIKLLGRWHSDAMIRYLHQEAQHILQ